MLLNSIMESSALKFLREKEGRRYFDIRGTVNVKKNEKGYAESVEILDDKGKVACYMKEQLYRFVGHDGQKARFRAYSLGDYPEMIPHITEEPRDRLKEGEN